MPATANTRLLYHPELDRWFLAYERSNGEERMYVLNGVTSKAEAEKHQQALEQRIADGHDGFEGVWE